MSGGPGTPGAAEGSFEAFGGVRLHWRASPADRPRAALVVHHGLGDHSGRYEALARDLGASGIRVFSYDARGHGGSPGQRGHVRDFSLFAEDLGAFRRHLASALDGLPLFLFGHSMGGLIALRHLQRVDPTTWRGGILSAPALGVRLRVPAWKAMLGVLLSRVAPRISLDNGIDPDDISRDREVVARYRADPLVHRRVSARLYSGMTREMEAARREIASAALPPMLWLLAGEDRICDTDVALATAERYRGGELRVELHPGLYHELHNEPERARVIEQLSGWVLARAG